MLGAQINLMITLTVGNVFLSVVTHGKKKKKRERSEGNVLIKEKLQHLKPIFKH